MAASFLIKVTTILTQKHFPGLLVSPPKKLIVLSFMEIPFSNCHRFYSKASEAANKKFEDERPPQIDLLADFSFIDKNPVKLFDLQSFKLSGFWTRPKLSKPMYSDPSKSIEQMNHKAYVSSITTLISNFKERHRGIPMLYPGIYGSVNRYGEIGLHTDDISCYLLIGKFDLTPIAIRTESRLLVINSELFKEVEPGYSARIRKLDGLSSVDHDFSYFERQHSFTRIILAIQCFSEGKDLPQMSLKSAISIVVLLIGHSAKVSLMRDFFELLLLDPERCDVYLLDYDLDFIKKWPEYCKEIYNGECNFLVGGECVDFEAMRVFVTLLNSRKGDRKLISEIPKKVRFFPPKKDTEVKFSIWNGFVNFFWNLLASTRQVEEI